MDIFIIGILVFFLVVYLIYPGASDQDENSNEHQMETYKPMRGRKPKQEGRVDFDIYTESGRRYERFDREKNQPDGYRALLNTRVAGTHYKRSVVNDFINGQDRTITLKRDKDNEYDSNAIAVLAHWQHWGRKMTAQIGFIPRTEAGNIIDQNFIVEEIPCTLAAITHPFPDDGEDSGNIYIQLFK